MNTICRWVTFLYGHYWQNKSTPYRQGSRALVNTMIVHFLSAPFLSHFHSKTIQLINSSRKVQNLLASVFSRSFMVSQVVGVRIDQGFVTI